MSKFQVFAFILIFGIFAGPQRGWAQDASSGGVVCLTRIGAVSSRDLIGGSGADVRVELFNAPSCKDMSRLGAGLQAVSIAFSAGAIYAACTGAGTPVSVILEGGALGLTAANLVVSQLPCDNGEDEARLKATAQHAVCEALEKSGIKCAL